MKWYYLYRLIREHKHSSYFKLIHLKVWVLYCNFMLWYLKGILKLVGLTLPLAIVAICYWNVEWLQILSQWLKVQSRWFKNYIFVKKCILISFWIFQYCFYYSLCHILLFGCLNFSIPSALMGVKQFRSWSGPTLCWVWSGSNLFAKVISRQQKSPLAGKEITTKQLVDTTIWLKPRLKLILYGSNFFHLARVLDATNLSQG